MDKQFNQRNLVEEYYLKLVKIGSTDGWKGDYLQCPLCGYYVYKGNGYDKCPCGNISVDSDMLRVTIEKCSEMEIKQFESYKISEDKYQNEKTYMENGNLVWITKTGNRKEYKKQDTDITKYIFSDKWIYVMEDYNKSKVKSNLYRINRTNETIHFYKLNSDSDKVVNFSIDRETLKANTWDCFLYTFDKEMKIMHYVFTK
jgi:hypothetical protein